MPDTIPALLPMPRNVHSQIYWGYHSNSRGNRATLYMDILAIQTRTDQAEFNFNLIWFPDEHINNKSRKKKNKKKRPFSSHKGNKMCQHLPKKGIQHGVEKAVLEMTACSWTPAFPVNFGGSLLHVAGKELQNLRKNARCSIQPVWSLVLLPPWGDSLMNQNGMQPPPQRLEIFQQTRNKL